MSVYDTLNTVMVISGITIIICFVMTFIILKIEDKISIKKGHIYFIISMVFFSIGLVFVAVFLSTIFIFKYSSHKYSRYVYDIDAMIKDYNITRTEYSTDVNKSNVDYVVKYSVFGHEEWIHFIKKTEDTDKYLITETDKYLIKE